MGGYVGMLYKGLEVIGIDSVISEIFPSFFFF